MNIFSRNLISYSILCFLVTLVFVCCTYADDSHNNMGSNIPLQVEIFKKNRKSIQCISGIQFSPVFFHKDLPTFNYARTSIRLGWMLNDPGAKKSLFRGNWEAVFELSSSAIFKGSGDYIMGIAALLRYNFLQSDSQLVPYIQGGAGIAYTDAYYYPAIGQGFNFTPQASMGLRYLVNRFLSIDAEAMFHHISNAGLDSRNKGVNSFGGYVGITYYFD